jgi:5'-nucleotidase
LLILISNDDGIQARGIQILSRTIQEWADVVVVAPEHEQSAASHSLTLHRPLRIRRVKKDHYAVNGTPTDCVTLAIHQILDRRPDLVISGINRGANLGDDVHYSGTVSAAMEGAILNIPSVAVSLAVFGDARCHYVTAAEIALRFCKKISRLQLPKRALFNINVPNVPAKDLEGVEVTTLGKRNYGDIIVEKTDPHGHQYYWIGGNQTEFYDLKGSDCKVISQNKVSITPLKTDLTHRSLIKELKSWSKL